MLLHIHATFCNYRFMDEKSQDWDDLRLFAAVARKGGLAAAAGSTGKSAPTLGRRMLALERRLGCELFRRLPRGYELTAKGEALLEHVAAVEAHILPLLSARSHGGIPVVLSAGVWVMRLLCTNAHALIARDPVSLRFVADDAKADIARREAMIGVRNARPDGGAMAVRRIGRVRFAVYAREETVKTWVRVLGTTPSAKWAARTDRAPGDIEVTHPRSALDLALAGTARALLPTFVGAAEASLRRVSPYIEELDHDQWLVTHHEDRYLPEVRRIIDRTHALLADVCMQHADE